MQGKKELIPKMLYQVHIDDLVPQNNFYRLLDQALDLHFLYKETHQYYGYEGNESIDPIVFFKICLIGYLNNINSDRKLIEYCSNCLDIRLYLQYDIDEALPWHSTIIVGDIAASLNASKTLWYDCGTYFLIFK